MNNADFNTGMDYLTGLFTDRTDRTILYYASETHSWYRVTRREVARLGAMLNGGAEEAYSHWCSGTPSRPARQPRPTR